MRRRSLFGSSSRSNPPLPSLRKSRLWFIDSVTSRSQKPSWSQSTTLSPESIRLDRVSMMACRRSPLTSERLKWKPTASVMSRNGGDGLWTREPSMKSNREMTHSSGAASTTSTSRVASTTVRCAAEPGPPSCRWTFANARSRDGSRRNADTFHEARSTDLHDAVCNRSVSRNWSRRSVSRSVASYRRITRLASSIVRPSSGLGNRPRKSGDKPRDARAQSKLRTPSRNVDLMLF